MSDLLALADEIERAAEGSRELDILIGDAVDLRVDECDLSFRQSFEICGMEQMLRMAESHQNIWREALPRYTTSLDAALSLVPEGWHWCACSDERPGFANVHQLVSGVGPANSAEAASPALALCAASLRAIHQGRSK